MLNFCTLFNTSYLAKGLALYHSLTQTCPAFHLYIFAFDDITYNILTQKKLENATIISLNQFDNEHLIAVKPERSMPEYCWTCTPFTIKHCIETYSLKHCTYVDADTFFYSDPAKLIEDMGDNSVLITPHYYYPLYDQSAMSGIYCVQYTTFKQTEAGMKVLNWWAQACIKWCYARYEDGKMGDQKYLDSWPYMFEGVQICRNIGAGLAPWNSLNYTYKYTDKKVIVNDTELIFYHFHDLKYLSDNLWYLGGYNLPEFITRYIYKEYIQILIDINNDLNNEFGKVDALGTTAIEKFNMLSTRYKLSIYWLNIKRSFRQFIGDLLFVEKRKFYKNNFIKIN